MALTAISHRPAESADININWASRDSCNSYIEQRRAQLKKDEEDLELTRDELMRTQKETIVQGLCKLNKDVKKLTIKEFNATFGCDVIDLIVKQMAAGDVQSNGKKRTRVIAGGAATANGLSLKTPAASRMGKPPMTMRTARRGEKIQS